MKLIVRSLSLCLLVVLAVALPGRAGAATAPAASTAAAAQKRALVSDDLLNAVDWTQNAVEHDLICREVYRDAEEKLVKALHDKHWDALPHNERKNDYTDLKPAVILDVDETVLDNSAYEARLIRQHKEFNDASFAFWAESEKDTAIPGALAFTKFAARHGVRVFYITNRDQSLDKPTLDNLRKLGFPVKAADLLGLGAYVKGCDQLGSQKTCRRELVGQHYRVLMQFGDQVGDFLTVLDNTVTGRRKAVAPYRKWFGQRWFVLPNPMYGSWEPAMFHNDWELPTRVRRQDKINALHTGNGRT